MTPTLIVLLLCLCAVAWLQVWLALRIRRAVPVLAHVTHANGVKVTFDLSKNNIAPKLSMLVPAKDEGEAIGDALESKLNCGYPVLQVVAINDRSTDNTGEIMARVKQKFSSLTTVHIEQLPDGWLGKMHALHVGLQASDGDWVLLSDADVHLAPGTLESLVAYAEREQLDMVAVFPAMRQATVAVDACIAGMLRTLSISARIWNANDDQSKRGLGVGAFNLVRREWLRKTNALTLLRMEIADDVALGALMRQSGAKTRFFAGQSAVSLTFQPTLAAVAGSANKGGGMFRWSLWRPFVIAAAPLVVELALPLAAIASPSSLLRVLGSLTLVGTTLAHVLLAMHFRAPLRGALLWPLGHLITSWTVLVAGLSAYKQQGIFWRNTFYSRAVVDAGRCLDLVTLTVKVPPQ
jgi:cellulose synthase/poly-beta-1,6-N-acetylglucosamine synthase-like glycosyltransferase